MANIPPASIACSSTTRMSMRDANAPDFDPSKIQVQSFFSFPPFKQPPNIAGRVSSYARTDNSQASRQRAILSQFRHSLNACPITPKLDLDPFEWVGEVRPLVKRNDYWGFLQYASKNSIPLPGGWNYRALFQQLPSFLEAVACLEAAPQLISGSVVNAYEAAVILSTARLPEKEKLRIANEAKLAVIQRNDKKWTPETLSVIVDYADFKSGEMAQFLSRMQPMRLLQPDPINFLSLNKRTGLTAVEVRKAVHTVLSNMSQENLVGLTTMGFSRRIPTSRGYETRSIPVMAAWRLARASFNDKVLVKRINSIYGHVTSYVSMQFRLYYSYLVKREQMRHALIQSIKLPPIAKEVAGRFDRDNQMRFDEWLYPLFGEPCFGDQLETYQLLRSSAPELFSKAESKRLLLGSFRWDTLLHNHKDFADMKKELGSAIAEELRLQLGSWASYPWNVFHPAEMKDSATFDLFVQLMKDDRWVLEYSLDSMCKGVKTSCLSDRAKCEADRWIKQLTAAVNTVHTPSPQRRSASSSQ